MQLTVRVIVGVVGLLGLVMAGAIWLHPDNMAAQFGLGVAGVVGPATIRADLAGFFAASGLLALGAAIRNEARYAGVVALLVAVALVGRLFDIASRGFDAQLVPPMVIEAVLVVLFASAYRQLNRA
jgi:hypothetical protein